MADLMKLLSRVAKVLASNVDSSQSRQKATLSDEESHSKNDERKRKATLSDKESDSDDHDIKEPSKLIMPAPKKRLGLVIRDDHHISQDERELTLETKKTDQDLAEKSDEIIGRDLIVPTTGTGAHKGKSTKAYYDRKRAESKVASFEEIKEITIPRSKLLEWHAKPFFDRLIEGCFVRLAIGKSSSGLDIYRLCLVRNVEDRHPSKWYHFDNKITDKYLHVVWGNEYPLVIWKMSLVSNSPPTKQEFDEWAHQAKISMGHRPTKHDVFEKKDLLLLLEL